MAPEDGETRATAPEGLSQFLAKVLDQLSLSAWLPSATLVGSILLAAELRVTDGVVRDAFKSIAGIGFVGVVLLVVAVVVLTTVTQAFQFESIRLLEGYWGPGRLSSWLGDLGCAWHSFRRDSFQRRQKKVRRRAVDEAIKEIARRNRKQLAKGYRPVLPDASLPLLRTFVRKDHLEGASDDVAAAILTFRWRDFSPGHLIRRETGFAKRLRWYPPGNAVLPTLLGNTLRSTELALHTSGGIEGLVQRNFHRLPLGLRAEHDESRTRLDLYCSMSLVVVAGGVACAAIVTPIGWRWPSGAAAIALLMSVICYRAAVTSSRMYAEVLRSIDGFLVDADKTSPPAPRTPTPATTRSGPSRPRRAPDRPGQTD